LIRHRDRALLLLAFALLHHRPRRDFFRALSISPGALSGLLDVFVLPLLL
jgi:hypothetical protein